MDNKFYASSSVCHFFKTDFLEIGQHYPFYYDFMRSGTGSVSTAVSRTTIQLSLMKEFVPKQGHISSLLNLWSKAGTLTNYASSFQECDWSKTSITVRKLLMLIHNSFSLFVVDVVGTVTFSTIS